MDELNGKTRFSKERINRQEHNSPTHLMSPNRRIFLNIVATYGRRVDALVCGLFISRWVLAALGEW